jgi:hypothetical protein
MKRIILGGCLSLVLTGMAVGQPATFYVNDGIVQCPPDIVPQIDALNFVNNNSFTVNLPGLLPFYTAHTLNYTNRGAMVCNRGFDFSTYVPEALPPEPQFRMASSFHNIGTITYGQGKLLVSATNIYNPGSVFAGEDGFVSFQGKNVDLDHGLVVMEGFKDSSPSNNLSGLFSGYWGIGTNVLSGRFSMPEPQTPSHQVTNRLNQDFQQQLLFTNASAYSDDLVLADDGTNRLVFTRAVFLRNTNTAMSMRVYFPGNSGLPPIVVEWKWTRKVLFSDATTDDYLYLTDELGDGREYGLRPTGNSGPRVTYQPANYQFERGGPQSVGTAATTNQSLSLTGNGQPNEWRAFEALFLPTTVVPQDTAGRNATNMPGRIEIFSSSVLDMEYARVGGPNTLELTSTNHFVGSQGAQIAVPLAQINLRNTNGLLAITNLMSPTIPRPEGKVDLYSCRWTNELPGLTNIIHVLFVDSMLSPTSPGRIQDLNLTATNIIISDVLNILRYFTLEGTHLTLTTNAPTASAPAGGINLLSSSIVWSNATPRLSYLTNFGNISTLNAVYFGGARTSPFYSTNFNEPYEAFVNHGSITDEGTLIWSKFFENTGVFRSSSGSFTLQSSEANLTNGLFSAPQGDVNLTSGSLRVRNHPFLAGRTLTLSVTNLLDDGGMVANGNTWVVGTSGSSVPGFNLLLKPTTANLLATTVSNFVPAYGNFMCQWAADDRGCFPAGYSNNAAVGRLILDGKTNSTFTFGGTGANNALYVDHLELRNYTTNRDAMGDFIGITNYPNIKVYFAQAVANGVSIAEKLDGRNGGRFCWVSSYAGFYSSTNIIYPDGTTSTLNAALVESCNLDSDNDGIPNCIDPAPIFRAQDLSLEVALTAAGARLSWQSFPNSTNYMEFKSSLTATHWTALTNLIAGPGPGPVPMFVLDPLAPNATRFYRVRVDVP